MLGSRIPRCVLFSLFVCLSIVLSALLFIYLDHGIPYVITNPVEAPPSISSPKPKDPAPERPPPNTSAIIQTPTGSSLNDTTPYWTYDPQTDANKYGLSPSQCHTAFGDLFQEISRAATYRRQIGDVTPSELDIQWKEYGVVRAMLYNQKLHILEAKFSGSRHDSTRALAILHALDRAVTASPSPLPDIEFSFCVSDACDPMHTHNIWALSRLAEDKKTWLMPDFGYWAWPLDLVGGYEQIRAEIVANENKSESGQGWNEKIPKVVWRGAVTTNKLREALIGVTWGKSWADVQGMQWKNRTHVSEWDVANAISMVDHCAYQFVVQTEGRSYSGRGKYLLNCASVFVMHKAEWIEPHHKLLVPSGPAQNFVQVERDFSDLEIKIQELMRDPQRAEMIVKNSLETFRNRYLTPAAQTCYWREMIREWADVSARPDAWVVVGGKKKLKGTPWETFVLQVLSTPQQNCSFWRKLTFRC